VSQERLRERTTSNVAFREASILADDITVVKDVILIRAGHGNLGQRHYYTAEALYDAAQRSIFEACQAYLDHPSTVEEQTRPERSVRDLAGWYSDITCRPYTDPEIGKTVALFADLHPAVGKEDVVTIVRTCLEYAKRYPRMAWAGLSINAFGDSVPDTIDGEQWNRVDRIEGVDSVDIVTRAGAGGTLVASLKESYRMKTSPKGKTKKEADVKLTLDADAVRTGFKTLLESGKTATKAAMVKIIETATGAKVTPEQDAEIDRQLGVVDGGALDKVLDDATGVSDEEGDPATPEGAVAPGGSMGGDCEADDAEIEAMPDDPKFLKAQLKKERSKRATAESAVEDAEERATEAERRAGLQTRERMAESVMAQLEIPEDFRPRLGHELIANGFTHEKSMREHAQAFDKAFIRRGDGAGLVSGAAAAGNGKLTADSFSFEEA
jgi:hypothetical protein